MEKKESPKGRRPLPTPGASAARPNTPVMGASAIQTIPAESFYAPRATVPALPTRPANVGSNMTTYVPPVDPPRYGSPAFNASPGFREPELITEEAEHDIIPDLLPDDGNGWQSDSKWNLSTASDWKEPYPNYKATEEAWNINNFDAMDYMSSQHQNTMHIPIDGRDLHEETNWWNPVERERGQRPGPGMLPPLMLDGLHDPEHSLFSVKVNMPEFKPSSSSASIPDQSFAASSSTTPAGATTTPTPSSNIIMAPFTPPTEEDIRTAVPHPNAYYCPKENGWVIFNWKSSSVIPPLAKSFKATRHNSLPDQDRRKRTHSCIGEEEQPFGRSNKTHHFHKYEKAVDSHKLTPPFRRDNWHSTEIKRQPTKEPETGKASENEVEAEEEEEEGELLDLYMCCQCSFYCVASGLIPGVIPRDQFEDFMKEKRENPPPGKTPEHSVVLAMDTILLALENRLWKGENRMIKTENALFQTKLGWNSNIKLLFESLGFTEERTNEIVLRPPPTDTATSVGSQNRRKLLRAWVELSAWSADMRRKHAAQLKDRKIHKVFVELEIVREMYQTVMGAHPDQIPRGELNDTLMAVLQPLDQAWRNLGLTPIMYSADLLIFAYMAQCRCDPAGTVNYFTDLSKIVNVMQNYASCPPALDDLIVLERSRDRFTKEEVEKAIAILGFGHDGVLGVDYDEEIPDEFVENAWKECVKRSWRDQVFGASLHHDANNAFRIIAEIRGSVKLKKIWEQGKNIYMNPDKAYDTLEIPKDVDDHMLITVFNMRLEEASQIDRMREAMLVIAEVRDSERLRQFLLTGADPGDIVVPTRPDLPRGLNQLGNTCYLNSLLQYFYTIKDLREAVMSMAKLDVKSLNDEKVSDDDLKRHRVGGRLVTRREIVRSKKFINQLAELFFNMEYAEAASVTPTIELAKLALVTSRDEEEDEADGRGTDASNDTDATLVEDGPVRPPALDSSLSPSQSSGSVLGKRTRELDQQSQNAMDVDDPGFGSSDYVMVSSPRNSNSPPPLENINEASSSKLLESNMVVDKKPPPLPPRKRSEVSNSVMMFGKQHDVSECMDNCMFQIETALLKFDGMSDSQSEGSDKTSIVKRLFYGKLRQRLTGLSDPERSRSSIHEKTDLFSHLPVNVSDSGIDIYDGLSGYFDDVVEFEGRKARMEVSLVDLPPVLQIQLQRVQFNRETLQPYKSQAFVKFWETIYLDRFMEDADPAKKTKSKTIQAELSACRERVRTLVEEKDDPFLSSLDHTSKFLSHVNDKTTIVTDDLVLQLNQEQERLRVEIEQLRSRINKLKDELETLWHDNTEVAYELTSVFIHRGASPSWGHYFFYSRHLPDSPDSWFKYNDSDVSVVPKEEVLADTTGSTANPYLLVFARKGAVVVDTVKRFDPSKLEEP